jgi:uncharacterized protein YdhG (YjbR/CyaY superfamily)
MTPARTAPNTIDGYINRFPSDVRVILQRIRRTIRAVAPKAEESVSYGIPMFRLGGALVYFAAFKQHIGLYPPFVGNEKLMKQVSPYAGPKGNLRFPLDQPMPYDLIRCIVKARMRGMSGSAATKRRPH